MTDRMVILATNIDGLGALVLTEALVPEIVNIQPDTVVLSSTKLTQRLGTNCIAGPALKEFRRRLPRSLSRVLEVLFLPLSLNRTAKAFLVLGDIPYLGLKHQILFVHNPNLFDSEAIHGMRPRLLNAVNRLLFRIGRGSVSRFIVQSELMKSAIINRFGVDPERIYLIGQPTPITHRDVGKKCKPISGKTVFFYPARDYPHKNHQIISKLSQDLLSSISAEIVVTIDDDGSYPVGVRCLGEITKDEVARQYAHADALLFPSLKESFGLPLVEAMTLGLPIICADRPYAREVCGDGALFFDPGEAADIENALRQAVQMLSEGWTPDWARQLAKFPRDWQSVAEQFLDVVNEVELTKEE